MNSFRIISCAALLLLLPWSSAAQNVRWLEITSGNFKLFTDTPELKGRKLVSDLEQRLEVFQTAFGPTPKRQFPIEILLFKKSEDFLSYLPTGSTFEGNAILLKGADRYFIVAQDKSPDDIVNDIGHKLGHVLLSRIVLWRPFWLEEGAGEYFRRVGRNPENKRLLPEDRFSVADLLKVVPSATYNDDDPATPFRIQSYRLLRILLDEHAAELRTYVNAQGKENGRDAALAIGDAAVTERLNQYTETRLPMASTMPALQVRDISLDVASIHRGDALVAAGQSFQAAQGFEGKSDDARAGRAILARMNSGKEAEPAMERAMLEFPNNGLVQFYFGSLESQDDRVLKLQLDALDRATRLLPLFGRAYAEQARVLTLSGRADESLPLLDRALSLEPEYGDQIYLYRATALMALRRFDEGLAAAKLARALPHSDRAAASLYDRQAALAERAIQDLITAAERLQVEQLFGAVESEALRREPPKPPPPPPAPPRAGQIDYQYEATNVIEIVNTELPDYATSLVRSGKTGKVTLQVNVGSDGKVTGVTVLDSQIPEMNASTTTAVRRWTFKPLVLAGRPSAFAIKLIFTFSLQ